MFCGSSSREAYDALARHQEYGGEGFVVELLPSAGPLDADAK